MLPDKRFLDQPQQFWAHIRLISQHVGYTVRGKGQILIPNKEQIMHVMKSLELNHQHIIKEDGEYTEFGGLIFDYFAHRSHVLNEYVEPRLMDVKKARNVFNKFKKELRPKCPIPMNKQKGEKKTPAYFTGIVNMLIESNIAGLGCDYDPKKLISVTKNNIPLRTLSRRTDGAFPTVINPIAVWEIKEYYYTTTFGSRVADGVYETILDGMELYELNKTEGIHIKHYLMIDDHYTWWECGRSYLCRIFDALHIGYIDEVLFGSEVIERIPAIAAEWIKLCRIK